MPVGKTATTGALVVVPSTSTSATTPGETTVNRARTEA